MCFQGFATFRCGHTSMYTDECSYAKEVDLPLFLAIDCPNYDIASLKPDTFCGTGRFYCSQTEDGKYLDNVCSHKKDVEARLQALRTTLEHKVLPYKHRLTEDVAQMARNNSLRAMQLWETHPDVEKLKAVVKTLAEEKRGCMAKKDMADQILHYSKQFFLLQMQCGSRPYRAGRLPDYLRRFQTHMQSQAYRSQTRASLQTPSPLAAVDSWNNSGVHNAYAAATADAHSMRLAAVNDAFVNIPATPITAGAKKKHSDTRVDASDSLNALHYRRSLPKERRRGRPTATASAPRRSARVRDKKVNYAEDVSDQSLSRSASPERSEASDFSPSRSDASTIRVSRPVRGGTLFRDIIKEATRKDDSFFAAGRPTVKDEVSLDGNEKPESLTTQREGSPDTLNLGGADAVDSRKLMLPSIAGNGSASGKRIWSVNKGDFDVSLTPDGLRHHDYSRAGLFQSGVTSTPNFSYETLQKRFFDSPNDLTPPYLSQTQATTASDPQKRTFSAFSPELLSSKKICLSMPGEHQLSSKSSHMGRDFSVSSPLRKCYPQDADHQPRAASTPLTPPKGPPLTAPILQPSHTAFNTWWQHESAAQPHRSTAHSDAAIESLDLPPLLPGGDDLGCGDAFMSGGYSDLDDFGGLLDDTINTSLA